MQYLRKKCTQYIDNYELMLNFKIFYQINEKVLKMVCT